MRSEPSELLTQFCNESLQEYDQKNQWFTISTCTRIAYTVSRHVKSSRDIAL